MADEQMAIIRDPGYGMRDFANGPGLWFTVHLSDHSAALQCFHGEAAERIFIKGQIYNVADLHNRACYVRCDGTLVEFVRLAKFD